MHINALKTQKCPPSPQTGLALVAPLAYYHKFPLAPLSGNLAPVSENSWRHHCCTVLYIAVIEIYIALMNE